MDGMKNQPKRAFSGPELCRLEAHVVVAMLRAGDISAAELLEASRVRVEAVDDAVNAMPMRCFERAMRQLDAWRDGDAAGDNNITIADKNAPGYLGGLPVGIKDLNHVGGVPTTFGTLGLRDHVPARSEPLVERLEAPSVVGAWLGFGRLAAHAGRVLRRGRLAPIAGPGRRRAG